MLRSFRFKIVLYTFLSLIYTALTEGAFFLMIQSIRNLLGLGKPVMDPASRQLYLNNMANAGVYGNAAQGNTFSGYGNDLGPAQGFMSDGFGMGIWILLFIVMGMILFMVYFLLLTQKFSLYMKQIINGINKIAHGDLSSRIAIKDKDEFAAIGNCINDMAQDFGQLMENERKNDKAKRDLITNVAHDLRTPLTSIIGYLELTLREPQPDPETRQKYIEVAYDKSIRLEKLIGDLFNYTKLESNEVVLKCAPLNIVKLMEQMIDEFYPAFQEAGLEYEFITDSDTAMVYADGDMLARAFSNLIGNAVKYGKDGKNIRVRVSQTPLEVKVAIVNYGEVIPASDLNYIFDRFYRVENSRNAETGGTGLGLAIAKKIVLMHDGIIRATSNLDGTIFEITLGKGGEPHEDRAPQEGSQ